MKTDTSAVQLRSLSNPIRKAEMKISVKSRTGAVESLECESGVSLMRVLSDVDLVDAVCGGECSCATCQVYVDEAYLNRLPPQADIERDLLEEMLNVRPSSRLACQITLTPELDGLSVEVAKAE
jgi:2Fe-2S ferredoxin